MKHLMTEDPRMFFTDLSDDEYALLSKLNKWLQDAENSTAERNYREESKEDYRFYAGKQDDDSVIEALGARPASVFNEIKPKVDMLVGLGDQIKREPQAFPVTTEDQALTEIMNGVFKHIRYANGISDEEMECLEHMVKSGRSYLHYYIDTANPFKPTVKGARIHGHDVVPDPDSRRYDELDARYIFVSKWYTEEEIKAYYPKFKASYIQAWQDNSDNFPTYFDEANDKYRLVEGWYREVEDVIWYINPMTDKEEHVSPKEFKKINQSLLEGIKLPDGREFSIEKPLDGFRAKKVMVKFCVFSSFMLFDKGYSPYKHQYFPYIKFGAYKDEEENRWFGAISMLKDPQRSLNTLRRQLEHLLQTSPKGILMSEVGKILNYDEYKEHSSEPNFMLELDEGAIDKVKFTDQPTISPVYGQLDSYYTQAMKDISGIQDPLMGIQTSSREPGVTAQMRLESNIAVLFILFNNFRKSRILSGKILLSLVQQYITYETVIRIEGQEGMQLMEINSQINPQAPNFNDISAGEFDMMIDEGAENVTMRKQIANTLSELAHNNPDMIPVELIFEYLDMPLSAKNKAIQYRQEAIERETALRMAEIEAKESKSTESKGD